MGNISSTKRRPSISPNLKNNADETSKNSGNKEQTLLNAQRFFDPVIEKGIFPDNYNEQDFEINRHYFFKLVWQKNFSAPIEATLNNGARVLDICCGVGTWLFDVANDYPESTFIGIDIRKNYPQEIKPPNVSFIQADALETLPFDDSSFDFVFLRNLKLVFTLEEWRNLVINEVARLLKPGGWMEVAEHPFQILNVGPRGKAYMDIASSAIISRGFDPELIPLLSQIIKDTNKFQTIELKDTTCPIGDWGGIPGKACAADFKHILEVVEEFATQTLRFSAHTYRIMLDKLVKEMNEQNSYFKFQKIVGRKLD
ncbi:hypothetical protein G9A89_007243 [Geosiphon pyriformis]|nr:hypothetical protein G9A89_007243 [Geosiphon pyriformis]